MAIFILPEEVILLILQHLDSKDRIAFACTCTRSKQICLNGGAIRKVDLSRCAVRRQRSTIIECLRDKHMVQHIRELNLNNQHLINWELDINLSQFTCTFCPHLEALHVLHCGMSLKTLHCILQHAFRLKALSWSVTDIKDGDIEFLVQDMESPNGICLENIIYLHLEIAELKSHIQILQHLVLPHCKHLEELKIYIWNLKCLYAKELLWKVERSWKYFPQPSTSIHTGTLKCLHSFTMLAIADGLSPYLLQGHDFCSELSHFVSSVVRKKSRQTKWKKFELLLPTDMSGDLDMFHQIISSVPLSKGCQNEFQSVKAFAAHGNGLWGSVDDMERLFQKINDNTVQNLHVCANYFDLHHHPNLMSQICNHISRLGGDALKFLSLSSTPLFCFPYHMYAADAQASLAFSTLFSSCSNITDLDLLGFHFEENICKPLSKLSKLVRIQFHQCAVFRNYNENPPKIANADMLTLVENCQNITELHLHSCVYRDKSSRDIYDNDLVALANLTKLKSLTLNIITYIGEMTFFKKIFEHCKFLTRLRIEIVESDFPIFEAARSLKHLVINVPSLDLGSENFWKLLICATSLETLCIKSDFKGSIYVPGAVKMLRSLPQLHVLHLHYLSIQNFKMLYHQIMGTLAEEKSDRISCFELVCELSTGEKRTNSKVLPINILEMCNMAPLLKLKKF